MDDWVYNVFTKNIIYIPFGIVITLSLLYPVKNDTPLKFEFKCITPPQIKKFII